MIQNLGKETAKNVSDRITILMKSADAAAENIPAVGRHSFWKGYVERGLGAFVEELKEGSFFIIKE